MGTRQRHPVQSGAGRPRPHAHPRHPASPHQLRNWPTARPATFSRSFCPTGGSSSSSSTVRRTCGAFNSGWLDDPQITRLTDAAAAARYLAPGWLAYIRGGSLVARRLDLSSRTLAGDPVQIADRIAYGAVSGWAGFSASTAGVIGYRAEARARRQLTWFDRKGAVLGTFGPVDDTMTDPALSPDAQRAAVQRRLQNQTDIWVMDTRFIPFHVWSESVR